MDNAKKDGIYYRDYIIYNIIIIIYNIIIIIYIFKKVSVLYNKAKLRAIHNNGLFSKLAGIVVKTSPYLFNRCIEILGHTIRQNKNIKEKSLKCT